MGVVHERWHGKRIIAQMQAEFRERLDLAGFKLVRFAKGKMKSQPIELRPKKGKGGKRRRVGLDPSKPGEYPKRVGPHLVTEIFHELTAWNHARWGTNVPYAKIQHFSKNRKRRRPWMTLANKAFRGKLKRLLSRPIRRLA